MVHFNFVGSVGDILTGPFKYMCVNESFPHLFYTSAREIFTHYTSSLKKVPLLGVASLYSPLYGVTLPSFINAACPMFDKYLQLLFLSFKCTLHTDSTCNNYNFIILCLTVLFSRYPILKTI